MRTTRRAVLACLLLAGCASPTGADVERCGETWDAVEPVVVTDAEGDEALAVPIQCIERAGDRRIRIGFQMPPGPDCYRLVGVDLDESADAVAVSLRVAQTDDSTAGACPELAHRIATEVDLQAPVDGRELLDGSR